MISALDAGQNVSKHRMEDALLLGQWLSNWKNECGLNNKKNESNTN